MRLSRIHPPIATSANIQICTLTPKMSRLKASAKPSRGMICVFLSLMISARPRALANIASVMMNGTILP